MLQGSGTPSDVSLVQNMPNVQLLQQRQQWQLSAHGKGPRLYVGGIPDEINEEDVKSHFEKWGKVVDIYFPGKTGLRVNYCFVTFDNWQAAQRSCNQSERRIAGRVSHITICQSLSPLSISASYLFSQYCMYLCYVPKTEKLGKLCQVPSEISCPCLSYNCY